MSLPTYDAASAAAREGSPFANGTEGEHWMANNCHRCVNDAEARTGDGPGCSLVMVAFMGRTPAEWLRKDGNRLGDQYQCVMFRGEDDPGPDEPTPIPDPPGQLGMFEREPCERPARMFADTKLVEVDA